MSRFMASVYDRIMVNTERACLAAWRRELLTQAHGDVLEVGAGTGANWPFYADDAIARLCLTEPDDGMRGRLQERVEAESGRALKPEIASHAIETLPYDEASFDVVVATLVLCSVADVRQALREIHRVLKPNGSFLFLEHVAAEAGSRRRTWQGRIEPWWLRLTTNCHLTRTTEASIEDVGFVVEDVRRESMRKALPWVRPTIRGMATKVA